MTAPAATSADESMLPPAASLPGPMRALVASELVSSLGTGASLVALPWLVFELGGSADIAGVVLAAEVAPAAAAALATGSVVVRFGLVRTLVGSDIARASLLAVVAGLALAQLLPWWLLVMLVVIVGACAVPHFGAQRAAVAALCGADETALGRSTARLTRAWHVGVVAGPAISAAAIPVFGATYVVAFDALTFLASAALVATARRLIPRTPSKTSATARAFPALLRLLGRRHTRSIMCAIVLVDGALCATMTLALPSRVAELDLDAASAGWALSAFGVGGIAGAALVVRVIASVAASHIALVGVLVTASAMASLVVVQHPLAIAAATLAAGAGSAAMSTGFMTMFNTGDGEADTAAVYASLSAASQTGMAVAYVLCGLVITWSGAETAFGLGAITCLGVLMMTLAGTNRRGSWPNVPVPPKVDV